MTNPIRRSVVSGPVSRWTEPNSGTVDEWSTNTNFMTYQRPSEWPALPSVTTSDNKWVGLIAVPEKDINAVALTVQVSSGTYSIDWGDGTSSTGVASNTRSQHQYNYSTLGTSLLSYGYKTAIVVVTPDSGNLTNITMSKPTTYFSESGYYDTKFLDIAVAGSAITALEFTPAGEAFIPWCQSIRIVRSNMTSFASKFSTLTGLKYVYIRSDAAVTSMVGAFSNCSALIEADISLTGSPSWQSAFSSCRALQRMPKVDLSTATDISNMFQSCYGLQEVENVIAPNATTASQLFQYCNNLLKVRYMDLSSATNLISMFESCQALQLPPEIKLKTGSGSVSLASMFNGCSSLKVGPTLDTSRVTSMSGMFNGCGAMTQPPVFSDTSLTTNTANMFYNCYALKAPPVMNTAAVTDISNMFANCRSMTTFPSYNFSSVTQAVGAFTICQSITSLPALSFPQATNINSMFSTCYMLESVESFSAPLATTTNALFSTCYALSKVGPISVPLAGYLGNSTTDMFANNSATTRIVLSMPYSSSIGSTPIYLHSIVLQGFRGNINVSSKRLSATALNELYTSLAGLGTKTISTCSGDGVNRTYTTTTDHTYVVGQAVSVTGVTPSGYNVTDGIIVDVPSPTTFKVAGTFSTAYTSGGTADGGATPRTVTVTSNPGVTGDDPTIAQNKGWTVSG